MKINLSMIGAFGGILGAILIALSFIKDGFYIWLISNAILGYVNRNDKAQLTMYGAYEIINVFGVMNQ